ncbi:MAG: glycoside hydrolase family 97 protein [Siphonobacter aquaeclarae]|nr:glycoside hydrolase family 97 protein [Siphonobacter aquaeclarae]
MKYLLFVLLLPATLFARERPFQLSSPDKRLHVSITLGDSIRYSVQLGKEPVILPSAISMSFEGRKTGATLLRSAMRQERSVVRPAYGPSLKNEYNELILTFSDRYAVVFRAYNAGIAWRFETAFGGKTRVLQETATFRTAGDPEVFFPETDTWTSWEVPYKTYPALSGMENGKKAITPTLLSANSTRVLISESDVQDYPGLYLQKQNGTLAGTWAAYPTRTELGSWGNFVSVVKERGSFLTETTGSRTYPWRIISVTKDDRDLLENSLVYLLAPAQERGDFSWVKPGRAAWEWWHDALLPGAAIPSGMKNRNTALYKHYIDFAAEQHLEYLMIDAGWSDVYDLRKGKPETDIRSIIQHGKDRQVDVFLWCVATTLLKDLAGNLDYLRSLGAAGIKVDFFDRDDAEAVRWMADIAREAAKRKLMVDFHGCPKPTGLHRQYPNVINYEAVRGAECSKWDLTANPDQHLLTTFIRVPAGPLDYTPGSMRNRTKATFKPVDPGLPMTQGTRCHELALFVLFNQPLAMLCDSPEEYRRNPESLAFLSAIPTVFDETRVLQAKLGEYAVMARRKGTTWYLGALGNWQGHALTLDFSFLPKGKTFEATVYTDAPDAGENAEHAVRKTIQVTASTRLELPLAPGGGAVAVLKPI